MALRYCPKFPLPEKPYLPGTASTRAEFAVEGATAPLLHQNYRSHRGLAVGIDLFNHGFFWEAHEVWEQTWNASGGNERELLQGLIQLAAANLNRALGKSAGADRLVKRAQRHLEKARVNSSFVCGIDLDTIAAQAASGEIRWQRRTRDLPGSRSDLLVQPFECVLSICPYGVVQATKTRADYHSGNAIFSDQPLDLEDTDSIETWRQRCRQEIGAFGKYHTVQWELAGEHQPSTPLLPTTLPTTDDLTLEYLHVLRAEVLRAAKVPSGTELRALTTEADWEAATQLSIEVNLPDWGDCIRPFTRWRYAAFRQTTSVCEGNFYAAFVDGEIASCLGVVPFDLGFRFQDVQTRESFRRRGLARALIAHAFDDMVSEGRGPGVIAVEADSHAKTLYVDLGFSVVSTIFTLRFNVERTAGGVSKS